jgi:SulP family sulfate permease
MRSAPIVDIVTALPMLGPIFHVLRDEFRGYTRASLRKDVLAGINVAAVALPLSLAFGIASGATGAAGLITAILAGLVIGALSGTPNQVSGPTGAMSAVLLVVAKTHGLNGVFVTTFLAGVFILLIGLFRISRIILLIPKPVVTGFTSGIAILIFTGQIHTLLNVPPASSVTALGKWVEFGQRLFAGQLAPDWHTLLTGGIVIAIMLILPKHIASVVPGSLIGVALATMLVLAFAFPEPMVGAMPRGLVLDQRLVPDADTLALAQQLIVPALSVAVLCCLQALLSGAVCSNLTGRISDSDHELIAQGIGNMLIPFFGGVPATGAVARTRVGIASGGQTRLTTIIHGLVLLLVVLMAGQVIAQVPVSALSGVLVVTAIRMNDWAEIRWLIRHRFKSSVAACFATMLATAAFDLTQAILIGMLLSMLLFVYRSSNIRVERTEVDVARLQARGHAIDSVHPDISVAYITGPMFFAAAQAFRNAFIDHRCDRVLILSMRGVPLVDVSGVELIEELYEKQKACGGELMLCAVQPNVKRVLDRSQLTHEIGEDNFFWSADQAIIAANKRLGVI